MITNPTIEFAAGIKVVHEVPLIVQCGIVRIIVADSLRWKMLPTFVPGHTHCLRAALYLDNTPCD